MLRSSGDQTQSAIFWLFLCIAAVTAVGATLSYLLTRQITTALGAVQQRAQAIASGDLLGRPLQVGTGDEFADLTDSVNLMQSELSRILQLIASTAQRGATATEQISCGATQTADNSRAQTDQTQQVATAMHEMMVTVNEISNGSHSAASAASLAADTAKKGGQVVSKTVESIKRIADSNQRITERVSKLGASSQQVGKIAAVIDDIADQTNLLALNAAIEAARAGEQGRGFAVVADEVRKLAERTAAATREIAEIVQNIQTETQQTVTAMEQGSDDVRTGVEGADQAGKALDEIISMASNVGDMVTQIATAATEQSSTSQSINANVENITGMIRTSENAAQDTANACSDLTTLIMELQKVIGHFRIA
jgi:methyl-accepting chemotaxis protein